MTLTEAQIERYSRHLILEEMGAGGQERLLAAKVLIVGVGGLGCPAAQYLAAAGVGTLGLVDADRVDLTNLQRQVLHHTDDLGTDKVASAAAKLRALNPDVGVRAHAIRAGAGNLRGLVRDYDVVVDGADNFPTKFLLNDACVLEQRPLSHAGVLGFEGQLLTVLPGRSACYRCVFEGPPPAEAVPSCAQAGVLGVVPGVIGCLQATEVLKILLGLGDLLSDTLLTYDALAMRFRRVPVHRNPTCAVCGTRPSITDLTDAAASGCPSNAH